jgi:signal transduction histidine kinase
MLAAAHAARLAGSDKGEQRIRKNMETIARLGEQMTRLIKDLLDLAKTEAGHLLAVDRKRQDGVDLVRQAIVALEPLAVASQLKLLGDLPGEACPTVCDPNRIQQVFSNLIGNAIKFTPEGGAVTVRARRAGGEIVFSVTDTGTGIPADQIPHLFDPYWQATERRGLGVGLGLSVAKAIVLAHGGRIWVESEPGRGSTFFFALMAADEAVDVVREKSHRTGAEHRT